MNTLSYKTFSSFLYVVFLGVAMLVCLPRLSAQLSEEQTRELIRDAGNYTSGVSINMRGYANGNYNIYERRWYLQDPFWRTGQAIVALQEGYKILEHPRYKLASDRAAIWMKNQETKPVEGQGYIIGPTRKERRREFVVTTDLMRGIPGLFAYWRNTGDTASRDMAVRLIEYVYQKAYTSDEGCWYDYIDFQTGEPLTLDDPFIKSLPKEATLHKIARPHVEGLAFLDAYRETGNSAYKDAYLIQCDRLLESQEEGRWPYWSQSDRSKEVKEVSYDLWFAEALFHAYRLTGEEKYLEATKATAIAYLDLREEDGTLYQPDQDVIAGDAPAVDGLSVAYLGLVLSDLVGEGLEEYRSSMDQCAIWLYNNRYDSYHRNVNLRRATKSQRETRRKGVSTRVNEDIGSVFALRFMCAYFHLMFDEE